MPWGYQFNSINFNLVDRVFEELAGNVIFHPATGVDEAAVAQTQVALRGRLLRTFVGRGLLERCEAKEMLGCQHLGFSVDAGDVQARSVLPVGGADVGGW